MRRFGGDSALIGKPITLDGAPFTVIGVLSPNVRTQAQLWTPLVVPPELMADRNAHMLAVVGRLAPGRTIDAARREMAVIATRLAASYPESNKDWTVTLVPLLDQIVGKLRPALVALMAAVVFVLLIACANVANLTLSRGYARAREVAIRGALGAGRRRIAAQMLTENVIIALFGGLAGVALASLGVTLLRKIAPANLPRLDDIGVDGRALAFGFAASIATALVFGVLPALQGSRIDLANALREEGRGSSASTRAKLVQRSLVITQIAFAMVLLTGATLLFRSFVSLANRPLGFVTEEVASGQLTLPRRALPARGGPAPIREHAARATSRRARRGGSGDLRRDARRAERGILPAVYPERAGSRSDKPARCVLRARLSRLLQDARTQAHSGRTFTESDRAETQPVTVVDEMFVRQFLGNRDPLTQRVFLAIDDSVPRQIIGVVKTVKQAGIDADDQPTTYLPLAQAPAADMAVLVAARRAPRLRGAQESGAGDRPGCAALRRADAGRARSRVGRPDALLYRARNGVRDHRRRARRDRRVRRACRHRVAPPSRAGDPGRPRRRPSTLVRDVLKDGARLATVGVAIGLLASFWTGRALRALLVGVGERDPIALTGAAIIFVMVAPVASLGPAARAVRADPIEALRAD